MGVDDNFVKSMVNYCQISKNIGTYLFLFFSDFSIKLGRTCFTHKLGRTFFTHFSPSISIFFTQFLSVLVCTNKHQIEMCTDCDKIADSPKMVLLPKC